jgi:two-component system chemotaxis response regulator CheY
MSYSVLIVDDSRITRAMIKRTLGLCGLVFREIHEAEDGLAALEVLRELWIDIVLTDLHMPRMNGMELVDHMAKEDLLSSIPVIVVSSDQSEARIEELAQKGVRSYLKKPFRPESLRDVLLRILGG